MRVTVIHSYKFVTQALWRKIPAKFVNEWNCLSRLKIAAYWKTGKYHKRAIKENENLHTCIIMNTPKIKLLFQNRSNRSSLFYMYCIFLKCNWNIPIIKACPYYLLIDWSNAKLSNKGIGQLIVIISCLWFRNGRKNLNQYFLCLGSEAADKNEEREYSRWPTWGKVIGLEKLYNFKINLQKSHQYLISGCNLDT